MCVCVLEAGKVSGAITRETMTHKMSAMAAVLYSSERPSCRHHLWQLNLDAKLLPICRRSATATAKTSAAATTAVAAVNYG